MEGNASKKKTTAEKIAELKKRIVGCKDPKLTEQLLNQLLGLHKSTFEMNRELDVPISDVREEIDFGACVIKRTIKGYLLIAKGGLYTFVEYRMSRVCTMLHTLFNLNNKIDKTQDEEDVFTAFRDCILYVFQSMLFASINEEALFEIGTAILQTFNKYAKNYENAEAPELTEEDYRADAENEAIAKGLETLANTPLPPEVNTED